MRKNGDAIPSQHAPINADVINPTTYLSDQLIMREGLLQAARSHLINDAREHLRKRTIGAFFAGVPYEHREKVFQNSPIKATIDTEIEQQLSLLLPKLEPKIDRLTQEIHQAWLSHIHADANQLAHVCVYPDNITCHLPELICILRNIDTRNPSQRQATSTIDPERHNLCSLLLAEIRPFFKQALTSCMEHLIQPYRRPETYSLG